MSFCWSGPISQESETSSVSIVNILQSFDLNSPRVRILLYRYSTNAVAIQYRYCIDFYRYSIDTVSMTYRYSINYASIEYRSCICNDTVPMQYRYRIDTISAQYQCIIDNVSIHTINTVAILNRYNVDDGDDDGDDDDPTVIWFWCRWWLRRRWWWS